MTEKQVKEHLLSALGTVKPTSKGVRTLTDKQVKVIHNLICDYHEYKHDVWPAKMAVLCGVSKDLVYGVTKAWAYRNIKFDRELPAKEDRRTPKGWVKRWVRAPVASESPEQWEEEEEAVLHVNPDNDTCLPIPRGSWVLVPFWYGGTYVPSGHRRFDYVAAERKRRANEESTGESEPS